MVPIICISRKNLLVCYTDLKTDKNRQNGRFYVIASRLRYVMTSILLWYDASILCPCLHQILSQSVKKHGHSGQKTAIIHPGGGGPDFVLSANADGFKVGPPCQGVN